MSQTFTDLEILNSAHIGFEFELYSKKDIKAICKELGKVLGKKIVLPYEVTGFNKKEIKAKPQEKPTADKYILTPDYSGGPDMRELITGPLPYSEARIQMIKILKWVGENGWTTDKCGIHMNISFLRNQNLLGRKSVMGMDRLKFCLAFDEKYVYDLFPSRKDNVYAASMKRITPASAFSFKDSIASVNPGNYLTPSTKYFGVNFLKQEKNYLEFRYLGGKDYDKRTNDLLKLLDHFILSLFKIIDNQEYTTSDVVQLNKLMKRHRKIVEAFSNYDNFILNFPEIILTVDLDNDRQRILSFWTTLRDKLYDLIAHGNMKKGFLNYDADVAQFQLKDAKLTKAFGIKNLEIFNSYLDGLFDHCDFYDCEIKNSHINECQIMRGNKVEECKIISTPIMFANKISTSYIDNPKTGVSGTLEACIIRHGDINKLAKLDDKCLIIDE